MRHAYGENGDGHVESRYELYPDRLGIEVVDDGDGFDPDEAPALEGEELSEGGLGIAIIRGDRRRVRDRLEPGTRGSRLRFVKILS